jgi:hypothetical protein
MIVMREKTAKINQTINAKNAFAVIAKRRNAGRDAMDDKIKELVKLSEENPEMEIFFMVDNEVVAGDDFGYWRGELENVKKEIYWNYKEENIIIGEAAIEERMQYDDLEDSEYESLKSSGEIKEAIIIYIGV